MTQERTARIVKGISIAAAIAGIISASIAGYRFHLSTVSDDQLVATVANINQHLAKIDADKSQLTEASFKEICDAARDAATRATGSTAKEVRAALVRAQKVSEACASSSVKRISVHAALDWQPTGLKVEPGDWINMLAVGSWSISGPVSSAKYGLVGPEGHAANPSWGSPLIPGNIGSLLVNLGSGAYEWREKPNGFAKIPGDLRFRINDSGIDNNDGAIDLTVILFRKIQD